MGTFKSLVAILTMASASFAAEAIAQTQVPPAGQRPPSPGVETPRPGGTDQIVHGRVASIDPAGTEITLTDGTRLVAPPGAALKPGVLKEGMRVIASYREENGEKVLTNLAVSEPSASPPTEPRTPGEPPAAPPRDVPKRY
jgi:hypothetical protein